MIELIGVSKWFGQVSAVVDVSVSITTGIVGLVGRNGAGKTTLMSLMCGLVRPSSGTVRVLGGDPTRASSRRSLALCPDIDSFPEDQSSRTFVTAMLCLSGMDRRRARSLAEAGLTRAGLAHAMHRPLRGYSKGMRQRTKLAVALAREPKVLLLDEPMTGLDPVARREIAEQVRELAAGGMTVLVSSHVLHELEELAQRMLLVHRGRLVAEGTVSELRAQLADRPYRMLLSGPDVRGLAAAISALEVVVGVRFVADGVEVETRRSEGFFEALTELGRQGRIHAMRPLDQDLEAVFDYVANRRSGRRGGLRT
jgi:ABC-2 type transport system ATP-binding protein